MSALLTSSTRARGTRARGFTLLEVVLTSVVTAIIMTAIVSSILVASRAIDDGTSPAARGAEGAAALAEITAELRLASSISDFDETSVTVVVPDRDVPPDGDPEKISYAWSGTPGDPLERSVNGAGDIPIAGNVHHLRFDSLVRTLEASAADAPAVDPDSWGWIIAANPRILMVVTNPASPAAGELARIEKLQSWAIVTLIDDGAAAGEYAAAFSTHDVVYVPIEVNGATVGTKLFDAPIGVVAENAVVASTGLGLSPTTTAVSHQLVRIVTNLHPITSAYSAFEVVTIATSSQPLHYASGITALGGVHLASQNGAPWDQKRLLSLDSGAVRTNLSAAAGRRVRLPWGGAGFSFASLTEDGLTILGRSLWWAAGADPDDGPLGDGDTWSN